MTSSCVALVFAGGAGIGAANVRTLSAAGYRCKVTGRADDRPEILVPRVDCLPLDDLVGDWPARACEALRTELKPDILIDKAGIDRKGVMVDASVTDTLDMIATSPSAPRRATQDRLARMLQHGRGRIVDITSIRSMTGNPRNTASCASEFGRDVMTVALAAEVGHRGVLVNAVAPGCIMTDALENQIHATGDAGPGCSSRRMTGGVNRQRRDRSEHSRPWRTDPGGTPLCSRRLIRRARRTGNWRAKCLTSHP